MTDRLPPRLAVLERRLERASPPTASPHLRRRVLSSIDDILHDPVPATESGWSGTSAFPSFPEVVAGAFFPSAVAAAVATVVVVVAAVANPAAPLSLDARARIAGMSHESLGPLVAEGRSVDPVRRSSPTPEAPAHPGMLRVLDGRRLFQETL